jgi:hypothetical protein
MNKKQKKKTQIRRKNLFGMLNKVIILIFFFIIFINNFSFSQEYKTYQKKEFNSGNKVLKITADKSTFNKNYGDSYRVLRIFIKLKDNTLKEIKKYILPVSYRFPDYPYSFSVSFEGKNNFVIIKENSSFFIYDLDKDQLSKQIQPIFKEAENADAQSGMITKLKIDSTGKYLIGHAQDWGDFYFDLSNLIKPHQIKKSEIKSKAECNPYTPVRGSSERNDILDVLRKEVYKIHKLKVIFNVSYLKVFNGWAWVHTRPQSPDRKNNYEDILGLIYNKNGKWEVLEILSPGIDNKYLKNVTKKYPEIPPCILPINNK